MLGLVPGLAGLGDDRLDDAVGVVDHPPLGALEHLGAALEAERLPAGLRRAGAGHELGELLRGEPRRRWRSPVRWPGSRPRSGSEVAARRRCPAPRESLWPRLLLVEFPANPNVARPPSLTQLAQRLGADHRVPARQRRTARDPAAPARDHQHEALGVEQPDHGVRHLLRGEHPRRRPDDRRVGLGRALARHVGVRAVGADGVHA